MNLTLIKKQGDVTEEVEFTENHFTYTHSQPGRVENVLERYEFRGLKRIEIMREYRKRGFMSLMEIENVSK